MTRSWHTGYFFTDRNSPLRVWEWLLRRAGCLVFGHTFYDERYTWKSGCSRCAKRPL